jgi:hypothetical protein
MKHLIVIIVLAWSQISFGEDVTLKVSCKTYLHAKDEGHETKYVKEESKTIKLKITPNKVSGIDEAFGPSDAIGLKGNLATLVRVSDGEKTYLTSAGNFFVSDTGKAPLRSKSKLTVAPDMLHYNLAATSADKNSYEMTVRCPLNPSDFNKISIAQKAVIGNATINADKLQSRISIPDGSWPTYEEWYARVTNGRKPPAGGGSAATKKAN